jgi:hypothetical protein
MGILIDSYSHKFLLVWKKPYFLNIANLLEVRQAIFHLKSLKTFFICLFD